jgi:hypothetical protein
MFYKDKCRCTGYCANVKPGAAAFVTVPEQYYRWFSRSDIYVVDGAFVGGLRLRL